MAVTMTNYAGLRWALIPAIAAHNFEEWLTFPMFGQGASETLERFGVGLQSPSWPVTQLALILVTIVPALIVTYGALGRQTRTKHFLVSAIAGIFFVNVFVPHVPSAIASGSYTPGVVTATVVNLPLCLALWRSALRERLLTLQQVIGAVLFGAIALFPSIIVMMLLADRLLQLQP